MKESFKLHCKSLLIRDLEILFDIYDDIHQSSLNKLQANNSEKPDDLNDKIESTRYIRQLISLAIDYIKEQ